jgi:hypothetical protein
VAGGEPVCSLGGVHDSCALRVTVRNVTASVANVMRMLQPDWLVDPTTISVAIPCRANFEGRHPTAGGECGGATGRWTCVPACPVACPLLGDHFEYKRRAIR